MLFYCPCTNLTLRSRRATVRNGFWLEILFNESYKLSTNSSKESEETDLVINIKKSNNKIFYGSKFQILIILLDNEHQLISKQVNVYKIYKHHLSHYYMLCWPLLGYI